MKILISPAKTMQDTNVKYKSHPEFIKESKEILKVLKEMDFSQVKDLFKCSDKIAEETLDKYKNIDFKNNLYPALFAYNGISYKYMRREELSESDLLYLNSNLRIISSFYGILKPFDGIEKVRLMMEAKLKVGDFKNLYDFWNVKIAKSIMAEDNTVINLSSKEYIKAVAPYIPCDFNFIDIVFLIDDKGKLKEKGTYSKMARGAMVYYLAKNKVKDIEKIKDFNLMDFKFSKDMSHDNKYIFIKGEKNNA